MRITMHNCVLTTGVAAAAAMVAVGVPLAIAAPTATPPSDGQGYVDSTARCTAPDTAVIFGATDTSRVAICKTSGGDYQYRGVRVRDGAKLIAAATATSDDTFVVKNDAATYTVTPEALSVTVNGNTVRTETWVDYHGPQAPAGTSKSSTSTSATTTATATTSASASATASSTASSTVSSSSAAPKTSAAPSSTAVPLPPLLPAEIG